MADVSLLVSVSRVALEIPAAAVELLISAPQGARGLSGIGDLAVSPFWAEFLADGDSVQDALAKLGVGRVVGLEYYAASVGIALTPGVDATAAFAAAASAMDAASGLGGLYCRVPPKYLKTKRVRFGNRAGFFCDQGTAVLEQLPPDDPSAPETFVKLTDPYATGWIFAGFKLRGGWSYGRAGYSGTGGDAAKESDPWLFQYPASITNVGFPDEGAQIGQRALELHQAYSGVSDATYVANSQLYAQNPRGYCGEIEIAGFGGDGLSLKGAGAQLFGRIRVFRVGGRGMAIHQYDSTFCEIDIGETGLENLFGGPNLSSTRILPFKGWYAGVRRVAGHTAGIRLSKGVGVTIIGQVQDPSGEFLVGEGILGSRIDLVCDWQGYIPSMDADLAAFKLIGGCYGNSLTLTCNLNNYYSTHPTVTKLGRFVTDGGGARPLRNQIFMTHKGWPGDADVWSSSFWSGTLDGNLFLVNDQIRQPRQFVPQDDGRFNFGLQMNNSLVGQVVAGPSAAYPGQAITIHQNEWRVDYFSGSAYTTAFKATPTYTQTGLPFGLKAYTLSTAPSPAALPASCMVYLTDLTGGALPCFSDTVHWLRVTDRSIAN